LHGTLEGCILKIISSEETYGYAIVDQLHAFGLMDLKEGTIYPLLLRLEKKEWITSVYKESPLGPSRKYYSLTAEGERALKDFSDCWREIAASVDAVLNGKER
jgi:PadR family transcriptional regulator PadR